MQLFLFYCTACGRPVCLGDQPQEKSNTHKLYIMTIAYIQNDKYYSIANCNRKLYMSLYRQTCTSKMLMKTFAD